MTRRRSGLLGATLAALGVAVAAYLTIVKLAGGTPACGPLRGCETVAQSAYSEVGGVPLALLGAALSTAILVLQLVWRQRGDRRALTAAYGLGLTGALFVGYLTYVELFVLHAVCAWCVTYGVTIVAGWLVAARVLRSGFDPAERPAASVHSTLVSRPRGGHPEITTKELQ